MKKKSFAGKVFTAGALIGAGYACLKCVARKKKADSVYENEPQQKNPMEGKKVVFVENEEEEENADGMRGHLEIAGDSRITPSFYDDCVKRTADVLLSFGGLVLLSPVFLGIAAAIKIDDPGPVFFTQKRVGKDKQFFKLHKFRTMKMCTPHDVPTHMLDNPEQYITRVGSFLRKSSLDELPQLWDIFLGNLSAIGPRPALWSQDYLVAERDKYGANDIRPGLTGWAQINGRDELEIPVKAALDGEYVEKESFAFDVKCFLGTIKSVAGADGVVEGSAKKECDRQDLATPYPAVCKEELPLDEPIRLLIAGKGSYIGESLKTYLEQFDNYTVDCADTLTDEWKNMDFSVYDAVCDVAGIAHIKETKKNRHLYRKVNTDLALALANKAKAEGVRQFVYLSSMSVYGRTTGVINADTKEEPANAYGSSKLLAEKLLWQLKDDDFTVSVLRPPMVFGKGCKGNYQTLRSFALSCGVFPECDNARSMLFIDNLCSVIRRLLHNGESGLYFPQNAEYMNTGVLVRTIADANHKTCRATKLFDLPIRLLAGKITLLDKVFGSLVYAKELNVPATWLAECDNETCIRKTERGQEHE